MALQPLPSPSNSQSRHSGPSAPPGRRLGDALNTIQEEYTRLVTERDVLRLELTRTQTLANEQDMELTVIRRAIWNLQNQLENHRQRFEDERRKLFDELKHQRAAAGLAPPSPLRELSNPPPLSASASTSSATSVIQIPEDRHRAELTPTSTYDRKLKGRARECSDAGDDFREPKRIRSSDGGSQRVSSNSMPVGSPAPPIHQYHHHSHHHQYQPLPTSTSNVNTTVNGHGRGPSRPTTGQSLPTPPPNGKKTSPGPSTPDDLTLSNVPPGYRKELHDWAVTFNPKLPRSLDVNLVQTIPHPSVVCSIHISPDGQYVATGCNQAVYIYDIKTGAQVCSLVDPALPKGGDLYIRSVRFSPDGDYLATGAEDSKVRIWNIKQRTLRDVFSGHSNEIYALDYSQNGRYVVSGSADCTAIIWDLHFPYQTHKCLRATDSSYNRDSTEAGITSISISPSNAHVAGGCLDHFIRIWSMHTGELVAKLKGHEDSVYAVRFMNDMPGMGRVVSGSLDCSVKLWDVSELGAEEAAMGDDRRDPTTKPGLVACPLITTFRGHQDYVLTVACSSDNRYLVSGAKDRSLILWDPAEKLARFRLNGHTNSVISADFRGSYLATASGDMCCRIWSLSAPLASSAAPV